MGSALKNKNKTNKQTKTQKNTSRSPVVAQWVKNLTSIHENEGLSSGLTQWVKDLALSQAAHVGIAVAVV